MAREPGKLATGLNRRVSKVTAKLDDHKVALGLVVAAVGAFLAYIAFVSTTGPPFQSRYEIKVHVPADAPVLRVGQAVRISGRLAGLISDVEPDRELDEDGTGGAIVSANITKPEFRPIGDGTVAYVRVHSIVYQTYLELRNVTEGAPMEDGDAIPREKVDSGVDLLEVVQLFDEETRDSLRRSVVNVGFGLAGRGGGLNEALADLEPTATNLASQLRAATSEPGALADLIAGAAATNEGLRGERGDDVEGLIGSGSEVLGAVAGRSDELAEALRLLPPFMDELLATAPIAEPLLDDVAATAVDLEPAVRGLNAALPDINHLLGLGGSLRRESQRIGRVTNPFLRATIPVTHELYPIVAALNPLMPDVRTISRTMTPYAGDIATAGAGLAEATSVPFGFGHGVGAGAPAGRVIPVLTPHQCRNPFPAPGTAVEDSC